MAQMLQFLIPQIAITITTAIPSGYRETHAKGHHKIHVWIVYARNVKKRP